MTTKNTMVGETRTDVETGWTESDARDAAVEAVIESHRYADEADRVLARYEDVETLMPSYDELKGMGVNVVALAKALQNGLDAAGFGEALKVESVENLNMGLEHLNDQAELVARHPDPVERTMHHHGECGCR